MIKLCALKGAFKYNTKYLLCLSSNLKIVD